MSGAEAEVIDDESTVEGVVQPAQPAQLGLTEMEIEFLETLIGVSTKVEDRKRAKYSVDVRREGNAILFSSYTIQDELSVSFKYDFDRKEIVDLVGTDIPGVKDFLMKYRIIED